MVILSKNLPFHWVNFWIDWGPHCAPTHCDYYKSIPSAQKNMAWPQNAMGLNIGTLIWEEKSLVLGLESDGDWDRGNPAQTLHGAPGRVTVCIKCILADDISCKAYAVGTRDRIFYRFDLCLYYFKHNIYKHNKI